MMDSARRKGGNMEYSYMLTTRAGQLPSELKDSVFADTRGEIGYPEFERLLAVVRPEDRLNIPTLSDLGNSLPEISGKWQKLQDKGVTVWILDCPVLWDHSDLFGEFLKYISYTQQQLGTRSARNSAGSKSGLNPGRKPMQLPANFSEVYDDYCNGRLNSREAGEALNVSHTTFLRWTREMGQA